MDNAASRRRWLELCSTVAVAGVAGCSMLDDDTDDADTDDEISDEDEATDIEETTEEDDETTDEDDENGADSPTDSDAVVFTHERIATFSNPHLIVFEASEFPAGSTLEWYVEDEQVATDERFLYEFRADGDYQVRLEATGEESGESTQRVSISGRPANAPPLVGDPVPELAEFDGLLLDTMHFLDSPGAVLAVAFDGEPIMFRGYGWRDVDRTDPMTLDSLFRIASLSKRLTRAAVDRLVAETDLTRESKPFELLDLEPLGGEVADERVYDITIEHCLMHDLGWDRDQSRDPVFTQRDIALDLELDRPPTTEEIVRHWLTVPLDFEPGSHEAYSNIGYSIVELLIEHETGMAFEDYLQEAVLDPIAVEDIHPAATFPADRPDREVEYDDSNMRARVDVLDQYEPVPNSDGGFHIDAAGAPAGLIATAEAYLTFLQHYDMTTGQPREGRVEETDTQGGYVPHGTSAIALQMDNGIDAVALLNSASADFNEEDQVDIAVSMIEDVAVEELAAEIQE